MKRAGKLHQSAKKKTRKGSSARQKIQVERTIKIIESR